MSIRKIQLHSKAGQRKNPPAKLPGGSLMNFFQSHFVTSLSLLARAFVIWTSNYFLGLSSLFLKPPLPSIYVNAFSCVSFVVLIISPHYMLVKIVLPIFRIFHNLHQPAP